MVPEVDGSNNKVLPMMTTADMSLKIDPDYNKICKKFLNDPKKFEDAFAKAWFKLLQGIWGQKVIMFVAILKTLTTNGKIQ